MAHIDQMLASIAGAAERQRVAAQFKKKLQKLDFAEVPAVSIDTTNKTFPASETLLWHDDCKKDGQAPITCRVFNLSQVFAEKEMSLEERDAAFMDAVMELRDKGCNAVLHQHQLIDAHGATKPDDCYLAVPCTKPIMDNGKSVIVRDVESAGKFIAYLLDKGYATPEEIEATFNASFLSEANQHRSGFTKG